MISADSLHTTLFNQAVTFIGLSSFLAFPVSFLLLLHQVGDYALRFGTIVANGVGGHKFRAYNAASAQHKFL